MIIHHPLSWKKRFKTGKEENKNRRRRFNFLPEDLLNGFKDMEKLLKHVVSFHRIVRHFLKKVNVTQVEWHTIIGTGDAALTGMLTGAVWAVKGSIIGMISHYFKLQSESNFVGPTTFSNGSFTNLIFNVCFNLESGMLCLQELN